METANMDNNKKRSKAPKILLILLISLIVMPLAILSLIYNMNKNFKSNVNKMLASIPGSVGEHFRNYPTEVERSEKVNYLSNYYINLDPSTAADKMYIIKKDDEKLYTEIVRGMNYISVPKTEEIIIKIRNMELRKDLLFSAYEEAQNEEEERFLSEVNRVEKQDIMSLILEIEKRFSDREFLKILDAVKAERLGVVLYYVDGDIRSHILDTFKSNKRMEIEYVIYKKTNDVKTLIDIAKVYETKPIDVSVEAIGNTNNYSMDKLGTIYKNLSVLKSAELLSNIKDEKFIEEIFAAIMKEEELTKSDTSMTEDISRAMEFLNEYGNKVKDLVSIYEKMAPEKVARIVEQMINNTNTITSIELNTEEVYELSDNIIIIDVLSKMKNQTLSKVLDFMEADKASQVTRLLARPKK